MTKAVVIVRDNNEHGVFNGPNPDTDQVIGTGGGLAVVGLATPRGNSAD